ncbi:hypothetical protein KY348_04560 [Candidatus Woesearchaeota archaeon]|nr:hypothetical protein [Candidatus Woesearchaeota archaeon]
MEMNELFEFVEAEHKRLTKYYNSEEDLNKKYRMFAKLIEETGELSEAILASDAFQRKEKLESFNEKLEHEFADVVICALILSKEMNVDMKKALKEKIEKIKKRKY